LIPSWRVGDRSGATAIEFVCDLSKRLANRVQVTSDGHRSYLEAVEAGFGADVDYAQLIKMYGEVPHPAGRYSPAQIQGTRTFCCAGDPDPKHISTSYVERQNLTMRMSMRRFTRLSNGFSKKAENHAHSVAIHFMHYNFVRIHQSLRVTPAIAAGVTKTFWSLTDMVQVIEEWDSAYTQIGGSARRLIHSLYTNKYKRQYRQQRRKNSGNAHIFQSLHFWRIKSIIDPHSVVGRAQLAMVGDHLIHPCEAL
jgi:hypothetical protein